MKNRARIRTSAPLFPEVKDKNCLLLPVWFVSMIRISTEFAEEMKE
jgi:hypothetical protein